MPGILYLSSTPFDLTTHRQLLASRLADKASGFAGTQLKMAGADDSAADRKAMLQGASAAVIVLGMVFGNVDPASSLSLVQSDYDEALAQQIPVLVYLMDEDEHLVLPKHVDTGRPAQQLADFKTLLCRQQAVRFFESADDLIAKILNDLHRIEDLKEAASAEATADEPKEDAAAGNKSNARLAAKRYALTPQRFSFFREEVLPVMQHTVPDNVLQEVLEFILVGNTMSAASVLVRSAAVPIDEAIEEVRQIERAIISTVKKHREQTGQEDKS